MVTTILDWVSSLDMVGRTAFANTKSLNRIQSIVCDAAYRTNENLLVCAPTGAGKTNVAMLCILQTVRQVLPLAQFFLFFLPAEG